jgi:hypothetical protein
VQESSGWMASQIKGISKYKVTDRAAFNTNLFFFDNFHQLWVESKMETMTNSFGSEQNSIIKLCMGLIISLSAMKEKWEIFSQSFGLMDCLDNLWHEFI